MCGGRSGPSKSEIKAQEEANARQAELALEQRRLADDAKRAEAERKAAQKAEDIAEVLGSKNSKGASRRSLFLSGSGAGFLGRY